MNDFAGKSSESRGQSDPEETADLPLPSPLTVHSSGLKLLVGVVSTVGRYREHNEDNYFVPGRKSVRFDAPITPEGSGETASSAARPSSNVLFIVADGMGASRRASRRARWPSSSSRVPSPSGSGRTSRTPKSCRA